MSKTDKTKPWRVRVMEHQPWANHDHRDGVCDLPATWAENIWRGGHCTWSDWNLVYKGCCCYGCGCRMCTDHDGRRDRRRRDRHQARREAREAVKASR